MLEACFCGRVGEVEDRKLVVLESGEQALECPDCGDIDLVNWLPDEARRVVFEEAAGWNARRVPVLALSAPQQR